MVYAILYIGNSGAGKSTHISRLSLQEREGYRVICPDEIREHLTGDWANQQHNTEVWQIVYDQIETAFREGFSIILDSTLAKPADRIRTISRIRKIANQAGVAVYVFGRYLKVPIWICSARNAKREVFGWATPTSWIQKSGVLLRDFKPSVKDGFDRLEVIADNAI